MRPETGAGYIFDNLTTTTMQTITKDLHQQLADAQAIKPKGINAMFDNLWLIFAIQQAIMEQEAQRNTTNNHQLCNR